ncbi:MAG: S49 family peptidase, partial [Pseudomonadota bacterium]
LDHTYDSFIARVAQGREMSAADVNAIAGGRVWTGKRAVELGLADQFGGLNETLDFAAQELGLANRYDLDIRVLPRAKSPFEEILKAIGRQVKVQNILVQSAEMIDALPVDQSVVGRALKPQNFTVYEDLKIAP